MSFIKKSIICLLILCGIGSLWPFVRPKPATPILFSVVMPVYNREELVSRAIRSVLEQSYDRFEFIIVDDGSSDKTAEIVRRFAQKDARIRLVTHAQNKGISAARNTGNDAARGDFITVMDSDDWMHPYLLEKTADLLKRFPDTDLVFPDDYSLNHIHRFQTRVRGPIHEIFLENYFLNAGNSYRRSFIETHHIRYDGTLVRSEDYDFWAQMIMAGARIRHLPEALIGIRHHHSDKKANYDRMYVISGAVSEKLHRFIGAPTHPLHNRCDLIRLLKKRVVLPPVYVAAAEKIYCPAPAADFVRLVYPGWNDDFVFDSAEEGRALSRRLTARIVRRTSTNLGLIWENGVPESFERHSDGFFHLSAKTSGD